MRVSPDPASAERLEELQDIDDRADNRRRDIPGLHLGGLLDPSPRPGVSEVPHVVCGVGDVLREQGVREERRGRGGLFSPLGEAQPSVTVASVEKLERSLAITSFWET